MKYSFEPLITRRGKPQRLKVTFEYDQKLKQINFDSVKVYEQGKEIKVYSISEIYIAINKFLFGE